MADNRSFESTLHDFVYSIDTGTGLKIIRVSLYVLLVLVVVMVYTATQFRGLKTEEAMDYAQLGRNFSFQNGMVTKYVRPLSMWKMASLSEAEDPRITDHPDLFHPPAYPALLSSLYRLFDLIGVDAFTIDEGGGDISMHAEQWIILPINHIFAMLTGLFVFLLGKRLFSREIGLLGTTIYFLSDLVWRDAISGLNITMAVFFVVGAFHFMVVAMLNKRDGDRRSAWITPYLFSILFAVLAFLTRYITIAILPGLCLFTWLMGGVFRGGTRLTVIFILLYVLMITPWLVRNHRVCGNALGMAGYSALYESPEYPGNSLERDLTPEVTLSDSMDTIKEKWVLNYSGRNQAAIPMMGGGIIMAFFLVTFFYHFIRPQVNCLRWGIGISLLLTVGIAGFFSDSSISMIHAFWPFVILYALSFFFILVDRLDLGVNLYNTGLKVLIVALGAIPLVLTLMPPHEKQMLRPYYVPAIARVSGMLTPREIMCSDMPWATAWYGDRVSVLLPQNIEQFYTINDEMQFISGLYITTLTKDQPLLSALLDGPDQSWLQIMNGRTPVDFPLKQGTSVLGQDQIFLSDRNRWQTGAADSGDNR